jgi:hypothetical protein
MDETSEGDKGEASADPTNLQDGSHREEAEADKAMEVAEGFGQDDSSDKQSNGKEERFEVSEPMDEFAPEGDENEERSSGVAEDDSSVTNYSSNHATEKEEDAASINAKSPSSGKCSESASESDSNWFGEETLDKDEIIDEISINFVSEPNPQDGNAKSNEALETRESVNENSSDEPAKEVGVLLESNEQFTEVRTKEPDKSPERSDNAQDTAVPRQERRKYGANKREKAKEAVSY